MSAASESLKAHGLYKPLVVQRSSNQVLCGNHVLAAARELGLESVAVIFADVDDETAKRIVLVDNKLADDANYDTEGLLLLLESLPTLDGTGFADQDVDALLRRLDAGANPGGPVDVDAEDDDGDGHGSTQVETRCPVCGGPLAGRTVVARPSKLTPETQNRIVQAARAGNYREAAARSAGIAPSTLYDWLSRGRARQRAPTRNSPMRSNKPRRRPRSTQSR